MVKGRFIVNPFAELNLTESDHLQLQDLANDVVMSNLDRYNEYLTTNNNRVDVRRWKPLKERQSLKMFTERPETSTVASGNGSGLTGSGLPMLLCVGTLEGRLNDLMYGVMSPTLESMRIKASYVEDFSGAAVLDSIVEPSLENPFQSLVVKWMEVDIPFHSTSLVKNRDYVYLEGTGFVKATSGEQLGYHLFHSINFTQTHVLPNRIRGNMTALAFWRQTGPKKMEMFGTCIMDPGGDFIRKLAVPAMASALLSTVRYAYCGQMKKLAWMLDKRYQDSKDRGAPNKKNVCVTCSAPIKGRRLGDFGKSDSTCKLCFSFVCGACKNVRKLSFVTADLMLEQRKVTFCTACIRDVSTMDAADAARAIMLSKTRPHGPQSTLGSMQSESDLSSSASEMSYGGF